MIICPGCGADMHFDPGEGKLVCDYCGTALTAEEYRKKREARTDLTDPDKELTAKAETVPGEFSAPAGTSAGGTARESVPGGNGDAGAAGKSVPESNADGTFDVTVFTCPQCGAVLMSTDETAATFCSYCGASVALEGRLSRERRPDKIIPFSVTKEQCQDAYRRLLGRSLFIPSEMKKQEQIDRFRGIYMPYWIYNFTQNKPLDLIGRKVKVRGNTETTETFDIRIPANAVCEGIAFDSSSVFYDNLSGSIAPFYTEKCRSFDPAYISGFYADTGDVDPGVYMDKAREMAARTAAEKIAAKCKLKAYSLDTKAIEEGLKLDSRQESGMFPVWFLATRSGRKRGQKERISYAVVNGQTGRAAAELPIDFGKYLLGSLVLAVLIFLLLNSFSTPTPGRMLFYAAVLAVIGIFLSNRQLNRIWQRKTRADDAGLTSVADGGSGAGGSGRTGGIGRTDSIGRADGSSGNGRNGADADGGKNAGDRRSAGAWNSGIFGRRLQGSGSSGAGSRIGKALLIMLLMQASVYILVAVGLLLIRVLPSKYIAIAMSILYSGFFVFVISLTVGKRGRHRRGRRGIQELKVKAPLRRKLAAAWKQLAALAVILVILIVRPVSDYWYYGAAFVSMLMTAWSFYDIVSEYNQLTTREIPQLGKRGGDADE